MHRGSLTVRETQKVNGVEGAALYESVFSNSGELVDGPRVAIVGIMHGNEPVGAHVLKRLGPEVHGALVAGSVLTVYANPEAYAANLRHTKAGEDLNRLWDARCLTRIEAIPARDRTYEQQRAFLLAPLLMSCDAILDIHSTTRPSPPFLLVRDDRRHSALARFMGVEKVVTGLHEDGILDGGMCPDVGLELGERSERIGMTFEAGQHDDPVNLERAYRVAVKLLIWHGLWRSESTQAPVPIEVYEVVDRFRQAPPGTIPYRFVGYESGEPGGGRRGASRTLSSFETVEAGEVLVRRGADEVVRAPSRFTMVLPTPHAAPDTDFFYMALKRKSPFGDYGTPLEHGQARALAVGIQRTLDMLDDDELIRGGTWASSDTRQVLDLGADLVARVVRMPVGHPHRKLTILGRGDWGGSESERRAGRRYRRAVNRAMTEGVDIDRMQLLRGAQMGWLNALTSSQMTTVLAERRKRRNVDGQAGSGVRLYLSADQPSTVSALAIGDIERAVRERDYRAVRVALIVEAATIEAVGAEARVRVVRLGLFSARPEFLKTVAALFCQVRADHATLIRQAVAKKDIVLSDGVKPVHPVEAPEDAGSLAKLGGLIRRTQLHLWRRSLASVVQQCDFTKDTDVGRWLADVMTRTGILDTEALKALLIRETPAGWAAHRSFVDDGLTPEVLSVKQSRLATIKVIPPVMADEVDADNFERWIGWKRFLTSRNLIPDTRGKDLDLAFTGDAIQVRVSRWFKEARERAKDQPGSILVVIAGDGLSPDREDSKAGMELLQEHERLLLDSRVGYIRIQYAHGTHVGWMKGFTDLVHRRRGQVAPIGFQLESEHGSSVNVVLLATRESGQPIESSSWSLDGWQVERCGVVVSDLGMEVHDYRVGLFTEPPLNDSALPNLELLQFGREHCEGLMKQGGIKTLGRDGAAQCKLLRAVGQGLLKEWMIKARNEQGDRQEDGSLLNRLNVVEPEVATRIREVLATPTEYDRAAKEIWDDTVPWHGTNLDD